MRNLRRILVPTEHCPQGGQPLQRTVGSDSALSEAEGKRVEETGKVLSENVILFAQTPIALARDPDISPSAKSLYALLHSYAAVDDKDLRQNPKAYISEEILARAFGRSRVTVWKRLTELKMKGWILIKRRGYKRPNQYTLIGKKPKDRAKISRDKAFRDWKRKRENQGIDIKTN